MGYLFIVLAFALAGCAAEVSLPALDSHHPAHPQAPEAPILIGSVLLEPETQIDSEAIPAGNAKQSSGSASAAKNHHWSAPPEEARRRNPVAPNAASIGRGKSLFQTHCASCHGPQGRGDGPAGARLDPKPVDLAIMAPYHPDGDLAWKIANGRGAMPAWKGTLSETEIWELVNFVKSLKPASDSQGGHHHHH